MLRTSSTTKSGENSLVSVDMAEDIEIGEGDGGDNETVERLLSKKPNIPIRYLNSLHSKQRWVFLDSFGYNWGL